MFTVEDFIARKCTYREYFGQYVDENVRGGVLAVMGEARLMSAWREETTFNTIPLYKWDALGVAFNFLKPMRELHDMPTLENKVCILKEAAQQIVDKLLEDGKYVDQKVG